MLFEKVSITMLFFTETKVSLVKHFLDFSSTCCPTACGACKNRFCYPHFKIRGFLLKYFHLKFLFNFKARLMLKGKGTPEHCLTGIKINTCSLSALPAPLWPFCIADPNICAFLNLFLNSRCLTFKNFDTSSKNKGTVSITTMLVPCPSILHRCAAANSKS